MNNNAKRIDILYRKHNDWLLKVAFNLSHNKSDADDMVQNLYVYLLEKGNEKIYYFDSFNLKYCYLFIRTRFLNSKKTKKLNIVDDDLFNFDIEDKEYNYIEDEIIQRSYNEVMDKLTQLKKTNKVWSSAKIFELYHKDNDTTIESLSQKLNLCKSTIFTNVKKVKEIIKNDLENPFTKIKNIK